MSVSLHSALKIEELLRNEKVNDVTDFNITDYALAKAIAYAKVICAISNMPDIEQFDQNWEGYGYLLKDEWGLEDTVTDIIFAEHQEVYAAYVHVHAQGVGNAVKTAEELGYQIVGWWHSHGDLETSPSSTDYKNFITVTKSVVPNTMYQVERVRPLRAQNHVYFGNYRLDAQSVKEILTKKERNAFAFSLIVNKYGSVFAERRDVDINTNKMSEPVKVKLNIKHSDKQFDMADIERDTRTKLLLRPTRREPTSMLESYIDNFVKMSENYLKLNKDPQLINLLANISQNVDIDEIFTKQNDTKEYDSYNIRQNLKKIQIATNSCNDFYSNLIRHFITKFPITKISAYARAIEKYNSARKSASTVVKALCRYAMMPMTNNRDHIEDCYKVNYFLSTINKDRCREIKPDFNGSAQNVYIFTDKMRMHRQLFYAFFKNESEGQKDPFLNYLFKCSNDILQNNGEMRQQYEI